MRRNVEAEVRILWRRGLRRCGRNDPQSADKSKSEKQRWVFVRYFKVKGGSGPEKSL